MAASISPCVLKAGFGGFFMGKIVAGAAAGANFDQQVMSEPVAEAAWTLKSTVLWQEHLSPGLGRQNLFRFPQVFQTLCGDAVSSVIAARQISDQR